MHFEGFASDGVHVVPSLNELSRRPTANIESADSHGDWTCESTSHHDHFA